jgi:hypothetical protein
MPHFKLHSKLKKNRCAQSYAYFDIFRPLLQTISFVLRCRLRPLQRLQGATISLETSKYQ